MTLINSNLLPLTVLALLVAVHGAPLTNITSNELNSTMQDGSITRSVEVITYHPTAAAGPLVPRRGRNEYEGPDDNDKPEGPNDENKHTSPDDNDKHKSPDDDDKHKGPNDEDKHKNPDDNDKHKSPDDDDKHKGPNDEDKHKTAQHRPRRLRDRRPQAIRQQPQEYPTVVADDPYTGSSDYPYPTDTEDGPYPTAELTNDPGSDDPTNDYPDPTDEPTNDPDSSDPADEDPADGGDGEGGNEDPDGDGEETSYDTGENEENPLRGNGAGSEDTETGKEESGEGAAST
ncbi:hypothetical protein IW261DRAFT_1562100 [Armillaria novae-zelandiae]|uniref:Uncharacterized protein n=1 Tax=Armillaria novae-zelandiae TaxID=153914 RepID=A0AA39UAR7_9AGAR|nr:hypothetical protein IW261DRAFT_1562100 [Armillaria novae-zelandiae]